jgi:hypothetical protein
MDGSITEDVLWDLFLEASSCPYCGVEITARNSSLDHIVPLASGGAHSIANVIVCCVACNLEKGERTPAAWLAEDASNRLRSTLTNLIEGSPGGGAVPRVTADPGLRVDVTRDKMANAHARHLRER